MQTFEIKMKWLLLLSFVSAEVPIYSPKEVRIYQKWLVSIFYHQYFYVKMLYNTEYDNCGLL